MAPTDLSSNRAADRPDTLPCLTLREIMDSAWGTAAVPRPTHTHQSFAWHSCMYSREMGWAFAFTPFPVYRAFRISPKLFPVLPNYQHCRFDAEFKPVLFAQILSPPFQTSLIFPLEEQVYKPDHIFKPITRRMLTVLTHNKVLSFRSPKYSRTYLLQRSFPQPLPSPSTELFY